MKDTVISVSPANEQVFRMNYDTRFVPPFTSKDCRDEQRSPLISFKICFHICWLEREIQTCHVFYLV